MTDYKKHSKDQLINRIKELEANARESDHLKHETLLAREQNQDIKQELKASQSQLSKTSHKLKERKKEIQCLLDISALIAKHDDKQTLLREAINTISSAWQYPGITEARLIIDNTSYKTPDFKETSWMLACDIRIKNEKRGVLEVVYLEKKPEKDEGPFMQQERDLLNALGKFLGTTLEKIESEEEIHKSNQKLLRRKRQLKEANKYLESTEAQNKRHLDQFKSLFDGIEDYIYVADPNTYELIHVNKSGEKLWGKNIIGKKCYKVLYNYDSPCEFCTNDIIFNQKPGKVHIWEYHSEENQRWFRCADKVIEWPDSRTLRFELATDITKIKHIEDSLRTNEEMLRVITENAAEMIMQVSLPDKNIDFLSPHAKDIYEYKSADFIDDPDLMERLVHPDWQDYMNNKWDKLLTGKPAGDFEYQIITKSGKTKWVHQSNAIVKNKTGRSEKLVALVSDVTERKHIEQKTQSLNAELETKAAELQQILYITTHDLRSPLVNIQGFSKELNFSLTELHDILKQSTIPEHLQASVTEILDTDVPEALTYITSSIEKMDSLLKGLLQISRLGRKKTVYNNLDINQLIKKVIDDYKYEIETNDINIELGDLHNCKGDYDQINQMFSNLLGNAIKFLDDKKTKRIRITSTKTKKHIRYSIQDNGIGIAEKHRQKIFNMFEKLNHDKPGMGLGMSIVKQVVEKHRGKIKVESQEGEGTTFHIYLRHINQKQNTDV
jgi:PAS domain S-box-containing protein